MDIQKQLKKLREGKGLSTYELSKLTNISQSTISKLENGKRRIDIEILNTIADAIGYTIDIKFIPKI